MIKDKIHEVNEMMTFVEYPKCTTCKKAKNWLEAKGTEYTTRHIVDAPLTAAEIKELHQASGLPIKKFFNTSGQKYRTLGLKDKLPTMTEEECYELLATDGMLVKRPLAFKGSQLTLGFKESDYEQAWAN